MAQEYSKVCGNMVKFLPYLALGLGVANCKVLKVNESNKNDTDYRSGSGRYYLK